MSPTDARRDNLKAAQRASQSPEVRAKAIATLKKTLAEKKARGAKMMAGAHSPAARRKAQATRRRNFLAKKRAGRGGTVTTFNVADLPTRDEMKRAASGERRHFTPVQRVKLVERTKALLAKGWTLKDAAKKVGIYDSQYRQWSHEPAKYLNGANAHALNGAAVGITIQVSGAPHAITLEEARTIHAGLSALLAR